MSGWLGPGLGHGEVGSGLQRALGWCVQCIGWRGCWECPQELAALGGASQLRSHLEVEVPGQKTKATLMPSSGAEHWADRCARA